ncbi:MAG TPA: c-type cytochrome, partial [Halioglobus sp.]
TAGGGARSGDAVYNATCMACHSTGAGGAPKVGDAAAWADRIAKGKEALYNSGINGVPGTGLMAKGGCVACSDEEIHAAVDHMVAGSQ